MQEGIELNSIPLPKSAKKWKWVDKYSIGLPGWTDGGELSSRVPLSESRP